MTRKFRFGQSRNAQDLDHREAYVRETKSESKRRHQSTERLQTRIEAHDPEGMLRLPDADPWVHLPQATLVQRHSLWVDLELEDGSELRAALSGKLKGVRLVCGDRVRFFSSPGEGRDAAGPVAQVVAVLPRRTLLRRGGIDDREPWQLICANADELWVCAAVLDPPLRPGLLERAQCLALDAGLAFRIVVTKRDLANPRDKLPELDPLREQGLDILETSAERDQGLDSLKALLPGRTVVLIGHSGVGKSRLLNRLIPDADLRTGGMTKYGTGRQTTTSARWLRTTDGGALVDTPGVRTLSVRGLDRSLLAHVFPEFPADWIEDPSGLDPEDEALGLDYPERLHNLRRLWDEMGSRNPNQNIHR
ncbi:MAG: ribosome small subunit-dependent GTPase A [Acidobacteria bacterium]|nr:ribosome small subunit-dependent GTPase A [Acidobacteriota bacterium]